MNQLGLWTLILLLSSLACTPLKLVFGWNWPLQVRKLLGLCAFAYVCLHFLVYLVLDQFFAWDEIWKDIVKRKFITVGFAAFLLLIPLAVTSPQRMVKRLGFRRWKRLHRLVYPAAILGVIHFIWRVKADTREPLIYGAILLVLLGVRVAAHLGKRPRSA
jgi:sulfoxide reductase heme-binding subunit YedZ